MQQVVARPAGPAETHEGGGAEAAARCAGGERGWLLLLWRVDDWRRDSGAYPGARAGCVQQSRGVPTQCLLLLIIHHSSTMFILANSCLQWLCGLAVDKGRGLAL